METPDEMNQREIAEQLGLSRSMVQKIEEQAIQKILYILEKRNIKKEDLLGEWI